MDSLFNKTIRKGSLTERMNDEELANMAICLCHQVHKTLEIPDIPGKLEIFREIFGGTTKSSYLCTRFYELRA